MKVRDILIGLGAAGTIALASAAVSTPPSVTPNIQRAPSVQTEVKTPARNRLLNPRPILSHLKQNRRRSKMYQIQRHRTARIKIRMETSFRVPMKLIQHQQEQPQSVVTAPTVLANTDKALALITEA